MRRLVLTFALASAALSACAAVPREVPLFARARLATDFDTYAIHRVGLLPVRVPVADGGAHVSQGEFLQGWFATQVELGTPYEVIELVGQDLDDLPTMDPRRAGHHDAAVVLELAQRFALDALLLVEVSDQQPYPPQRIAAHAELVSCETGASIWTGDVQLDARDPRVREGLEAYTSRSPGFEDGADRWDVMLLSPRRFAEFAMWQLAQML